MAYVRARAHHRLQTVQNPPTQVPRLIVDKLVNTKNHPLLIEYQSVLL